MLKIFFKNKKKQMKILQLNPSIVLKQMKILSLIITMKQALIKMNLLYLHLIQLKMNIINQILLKQIRIN